MHNLLFKNKTWWEKLYSVQIVENYSNKRHIAVRYVQTVSKKYMEKNPKTGKQINKNS